MLPWGCRRLSGGQLDGLYLCPRRNGKIPLAVLTGSGWNHWAVHPCSLLKAPFVLPPRMGSPKCTTSSRTAWLRRNIGSCRAMPLPACPIVTSALPTDRTCYLCRREGRRGCPLVARLPFAYIRTNGRFIPWKAEGTQVPSPGRWPLARPDTYPTWEVALGLPGSWVSPAQVSYFIVAAAATLLE